MPKKSSRTAVKPQRKDVSMETVSDEDYEDVNAGASLTFPLQCSNLRNGGHVLLRGNPCKIVAMQTSSPGKHGHAKVVIVGFDIFSGKKYEEISPASHKMDVPIINKKDHILMMVGYEGYTSLLDDKGHSRQDLQAPPTLVDNMRDRLEKEEEVSVTVLSSMGREKIISSRSLKK